MIKTKKVIEHWDFQTPNHLAKDVIDLISSIFGENFWVIIEPTCWVGSFLMESWKVFKDSELLWFEINPEYVKKATTNLSEFSNRWKVEEQDFFLKDWGQLISSIDSRILIIGNPPWVTSAQLWIIQWWNLPWKSNFKWYSWFDALTWKSNFDISEWMLIHFAEILKWRNAILWFLCKTSVARKFLQHIWKDNDEICQSEIYLIDAKSAFWVSVDACLLVCDFTKMSFQDCRSCKVNNSIGRSSNTIEHIWYNHGRLISNIDEYKKMEHFIVKWKNKNWNKKWRSWIKHDCSKVMELDYLWENLFRNGLWEEFVLEPDYIFPFMKSSDVAKGSNPRKYIIVTQRNVKDDTSSIEKNAPLTWKYLKEHEEYFEKRGSSIYKNRPKFSIFWIGDYTFEPYKIAISWLYNNLQFQLISEFNWKTVLFDDTVNFLSFSEKASAENYFKVVKSIEYNSLLRSIIFIDNKRPVTVEILNAIDLELMYQSNL